jgi:hypothetical protein
MDRAISSLAIRGRANWTAQFASANMNRPSGPGA